MSSPTTLMDDLVFEVVDGSKGDFHFELVNKFHQLCSAEFSGENEMEGVSVWINKIKSQCASKAAGQPVTDYELSFTVVFRDPQQQKQQQQKADEGTTEAAANTELTLLGGAQQELYVASSCGLLPYVVVSPAARGNGLARPLVSRSAQFLKARCFEIVKQPLKEMFIEVSQLADATEEDDGNPYHSKDAALMRQKVWERLDFVPLSITFLHPGPLRNSRHQLAVYRPAADGDAQKRSVSAATLRAFFLAEFLGIMLPVGGTPAEVKAELDQDLKLWLEGRTHVEIGEWR